MPARLLASLHIPYDPIGGTISRANVDPQKSHSGGPSLYGDVFCHRRWPYKLGGGDLPDRANNADLTAGPFSLLHGFRAWRAWGSRWPRPRRRSRDPVNWLLGAPLPSRHGTPGTPGGVREALGGPGGQALGARDRRWERAPGVAVRVRGRIFQKYIWIRWAPCSLWGWVFWSRAPKTPRRPCGWRMATPNGPPFRRPLRGGRPTPHLAPTHFPATTGSSTGQGSWS